mmetsp:Transcript_59071/g.158010  ORF Transcript_59071/g.158010 Transcript_59071/m.158010 type:complete len:205 (+) Transcript_59071:2257-2871(+)
MPSAAGTRSDTPASRHRRPGSTCGALPPEWRFSPWLHTSGGPHCWRAAFGTRRWLPSGSRGPRKGRQPPDGCWGGTRTRSRPTSRQRSTSSLAGSRRRTCTTPPLGPSPCRKRCSQRSARRTPRSAGPASLEWSCPSRCDQRKNWRSCHSRGPDKTVPTRATAGSPAGAADPCRSARAAEELHHLQHQASCHPGIWPRCSPRFP